MTQSMTGFARSDAQHDFGALNCEIRSVNHRFLETHLRLPDELKALETDIRKQLKTKIKRGKVEISFSLKTDTQTTLELNENLARQVVSLAKQASQIATDGHALSTIDLLTWPGILKNSTPDHDELEQAAQSLFEQTLNKLIDNRGREGEELADMILQRLQSIEHYVHLTREQLPTILQQQEHKLREKITHLGLEIDEERLTQEIVYIAQKTDVAEELDRLETHVKHVRDTLTSKEPIGRRLDFLMQELNREANTLSSKSIASETTQNAVDLKVSIEQMREQIQNIE